MEKIDLLETVVRVEWEEAKEAGREVLMLKTQVEGLEEEVKGLHDEVMEEGRLKEAAIGQAALLRREVKERGTEIAALREAVSKLKKEVEVSKQTLGVPKKYQLVQTDVVELKAASSQMQVHTYANVASQVEEVREEGEATDKMDLDPPPTPK